jgi:hypothetical protein
MLPSDASFSVLYLVEASQDLGHMLLDSLRHRHRHCHQIAPSNTIITSLTSPRQMVHPLPLTSKRQHLSHTSNQIHPPSSFITTNDHFAVLFVSIIGVLVIIIIIEILVIVVVIIITTKKS